MDVKANSDLLWRLILIILHTPFFVHLTQGLRAGRGSLIHKINTLLSTSCTVFLPFSAATIRAQLFLLWLNFKHDNPPSACRLMGAQKHLGSQEKGVFLLWHGSTSNQHQILNDTTQHPEKWSIAVDSMHESVPFGKGFE